MASSAASENKQQPISYRAYVDESGFGPKQGAFVIGGVVASVENWKVFSAEWQDALQETPSLKDFKFAHAMASKGGHFRGKQSFRGWTLEQRDRRLVRLNSIIAARVSAIVVAIMPHVVFEKTLAKFTEEQPYSYLALGMMRALASHHSQLGLPDVPVDFTFDENVMNQNDVLRIWDRVDKEGVQRHPLMGARPSFERDDQCLPLQAADMISGLTRLRWNEFEQRVGDLDMPGADEASKVPSIIFFWDEAAVRKDLHRWFAPPITYSFGCRIIQDGQPS